MDELTIKSLLAIPATSALVFNDVLSLVSMIGCSFMFLAVLVGAPLRRLGELGEWSTAPLAFGMLFQISFLMIGMAAETEKMGCIVPMTPGMVNGLFIIAFVLLAGRWWLLNWRTRAAPNRIAY